MELLEFDREVTAWQELLVLTKFLVSTSIKSAIKTLQILSDDDSTLGKTTSAPDCANTSMKLTSEQQKHFCRLISNFYARQRYTY